MQTGSDAVWSQPGLQTLPQLRRWTGQKRLFVLFDNLSLFAAIVRSNLSPGHRQALGKANKCVWLCLSAWGWILLRAVIISCVLECNEYMSAVFLSGIQDGQRWYRALRGKTRQHGLHGEGLATFTHTHTQKQTLSPTTQLCEHDIVQTLHAAQTRHTISTYVITAKAREGLICNLKH